MTQNGPHLDVLVAIGEPDTLALRFWSGCLGAKTNFVIPVVQRLIPTPSRDHKLLS